MGFLYGNTSNHQPRTHFNFYRIYPNRKTMQHEVEDVTAEDIINETYVPYGSYLLVNYSFKDVHQNTPSADGGERSQYYTSNKETDEATYDGNGSFDLTVWQVQKVNELPHCVAIARLHSVLPTFEVAGQYRVDILEPLSAGNYYGHGKYVMPLNASTDIATYIQ